jgi:XrtN system VIT domain protein
METASDKTLREEILGMEFLSGYILLAVSTSIFGLAELQPDAAEEHLSSVFFVHYFIALSYLGFLIFRKAVGLRKSWSRQYIHHTILLLALFLVSAFALNRVIPVFQDSTQWLCVYLFIIIAAALSYRFYRFLPLWANAVQQVMLGSSLVFYVYTTLFVAGYYIFGAIGTVVIGIGAHVFLPIGFLIGCSLLISYSDKRRRYWTIAGAALTVLVVVLFTGEWERRIRKKESFANQSVLQEENQLPVWVAAAEQIPNDWISSRIIKSDLVYTVASDRFGDWALFPQRSRLLEPQKHDPLVFIGSIAARSSLSEDDRIRILRSLSNLRHETEERFWSGENLVTSYVVSDVDIYPELRLAYLEKFINVRNNKLRTGGALNQEEALYTFQLPEGSVVTALSLWIDGKEQKALLTSKSKAENAYKAIVGYESRDPSVVHWQEGNTVTVRVFPCTSKEERKFKIGITIPLSAKQGRTIYRDISFRGPEATGARETTRIRFLGKAKNIILPDQYARNQDGYYLSEHSWQPGFEITFDTSPLKKNQFTFNGAAYSMQEYSAAYQAVTFRRIFLDLNKTWTFGELSAVKKLSQHHSLFAYTGSEFVELTEDNWSLSERLRNRNFSLFPFHLIRNEDHALVITKGNVFTPNLADLRNSGFAEALSRFFGENRKINVFNLGDEISTYVNSLRELRALEFQQGSLDELTNLLSKGIFPVTEESDSAVILHDASLIIRKQKKGSDNRSDNAPDHLARLFAYNDIMRKTGAAYFRNEYVRDDLVQEAATAYVVSPVSSLIVLETEKDYERFGIAKTDDSLFNASKKSAGAVPEPHEWMLIIVFLFFVVYVTLRR